MVAEIEWDAVTCCADCVPDKIPEDLKIIIRKLDLRIKDANSMKFCPKEEYGLHSTQIIALVIILWQNGVLK